MPTGPAGGETEPTPVVGGALDAPARRAGSRRRWRRRLLGAVAASYALDATILLLYAAAGATAFRVPLLYALAGGLSCAAHVAVYHSRLAEGARDPFLTIWSMVLSVTVQIAFLAIAPEVGFVFLTVLFIVFGFGAIRMTLKETVVIWSVTAVGVAALTPFIDRPLVIPMSSPAERWITGLCFLLTLGRCATIGVFGSVVRERLAERTDALRRLTASLEDQVADRTRDLARANAELERLVAERTAEIKTLRGVLPICAYCKKIRDDRGAWNQLEAYISTHSKVLFSHGICAACRQEHFPDLNRKGEAG
jgi:hypothetical protein